MSGRILIALALWPCWLAPAAAERLITESYEITIDSRCEEGIVNCNNVLFRGVERKTGKVLRLKGADMHTLCADGVTPCRFLGHAFRRGKLRVTVWENGTLTFEQGKKVLLEEQGKWSD